MKSHVPAPRPEDVDAAGPNSKLAASDAMEDSQTRSDRLREAFVGGMADGIAFQTAIRDDTRRIVDFRVEYVNEAFGRIVGRAHDELVGHRMLELFPPWAEELFDTCVEAVETGRPQTQKSLAEQRGRDWAGPDRHAPSVDLSISKLGDGCAIWVRDVSLQQRAEDELFRSQELLRSVLDTFPARVFWKDLESVFLGCNASFARNLGLADPSEIVGKTDFDIHAPADAERYRADDRNIMRSGKARIEYEEPMTRMDGTEGWARTSKVPIRDKNGGVIGLLGSYQDVTDQKRAAEALRESEEFLDSIIENIPVMVFVKDARTLRFVRLNRAGERILGYPRERLVGQDTSDLVPPDEEEHFIAFDRLVATTGQVVEIPEETITNPKAGVILMHTIKVPIFGDDGKPRYVLGISEDITARKAAERGRRESEERYRHIIESITNYIVSVRIEHGVVVRVNHGPGSVAVTGYTPEELDADPRLWGSLVLPEDRELVDENLRRVLSGVRIPPVEHRVRRKDGVVRWVRQTFVVRFGEAGEVVSYDGLIEDISEQRALQNQLLQAQKMEAIGRLAGGVAHDFNNLLTAILGYVEMCKLDLPPELPLDHPARQDLQEVAGAGQRAASLTRQLLTFASRQVLAPVRLDLSSLVTDSIKMLQRLLGDDIEIETALSSDLRTVVADQGQIEQLLVNLSINARDAMPDGGRLLIETSDESIDAKTAAARPGAVPGPHVLLSVTDTGVGMDEEVRSHLFEPFFTTKGLGKGTGLGLATCHGIVRQLSGHIEVYSEPDHGTMFRIHLPSSSGPADPRPVAPSAPPASDGTETVLVVEDEPLVRRLAVLGLRARGYTVLEAANGADAIQVALRAGNTIDLIVSDVMMPGMSGPALVRELATIAPRARAMLMSGHADSAVLEEAPELRWGFLAKPYTPERLARKVREVLDAPTVE
jgi:two-component system cell cycle sensor histidine kinase/response regulator CckA